MALQIQTTDHYGIEHTTAYARICAYRFDWLSGTGVVSVQLFVNEQARRNDKQPIRTTDYAITESGNRAAMYEHLKTLAEFAGALDV